MNKLIYFLLFIPITSFSHEELSLSDKVIKTIGIKTQEFDFKNEIPKSSLVYHLDEVGFYVKRGNLFYFIHKGEEDEIKPGDELVTEGVGLLRISDVFSKDTSEYGHEH